MQHRRWLLVSVLAAAVAALTACGPGADRPQPRRTAHESPATGLIAFGKAQGKPYRETIWLADAATGRARELARNDGQEPSWSSDGERLVFARPRNTSHPYCYCRDLFVINADGTGERRLTHGGDNADPVWSPDGTTIIFRHGEPPRPYVRSTPVQIDSIRPDGHGLRHLVPMGKLYPGRLSWSGDSTQVVFEVNDGLDVMRADGSGLRQLTPPGDLSRAHMRVDSQPTWSPTGSLIAFERETPGRGLHMGIFVIDADGTGLRRVTSTEIVAYGPSWSPDGQRIAFVDLHPSRPNRELCSIRGIGIVRPDGSGLREIGFGDHWIHGPTWSPDGSHLTYLGPPTGQRCSRDNGLTDAFVIGTTDGKPHELTPGAQDAADFGYAVWQPAG